MGAKKPRGWRTKLPRANIESPGAIDGQEESQLGSGSEGEGEERVGKLLTYNTVKGYISAIAELHRWQVSDGTCTKPTFRGPALQGLLTSLERSQVQRDQESFADRAANGIAYSSEELLQMLQHLLHGAAVRIQRLQTRLDLAIGHHLLFRGESRRMVELSKLSCQR
jgi:hypothetical protein